MAAPAPVQPVAPGGPGRFRRGLGAVAASVGLTGVFLVSVVGSVLLHLNLPPTRRTARTVANQIFAGLFQGKLEVGEIDRLSLRGVTIRSAKAWDTSGAQVIDAAGLKADADVVAIVKSVVAGAGDIQVMVPLVRLDHADVALLKGPDGKGPTIASVFLPKKPGPPPPPGARKARVVLDRIEIGHVWAHGDMAPPGIDGELSKSVGHFEVSPDGLVIDVSPTRFDVRAPLPQPLAGNATYRLRGGDKGISMEATFDGSVGDLQVRIPSAKLEGARVGARIEIPHATAGAVASLIPGPPPKIPLKVPVSAVIEADGEIPEIAFKTTFDFEGGGRVAADGTVALRSPVTVDVGVTISGVDPRIALDLPSATPVDAKAHVFVEAGSKLKIDAEAQTKPFNLAGNVVPAVDAKVALSDGKWKGGAKVDEVGAPVQATFSYDPGQDNLAFDVTATVASLHGIKRVPIPVDGAGSVQVKGAMRKGSLDARVSAKVTGIHGPPSLAAEGISVDARFTGPPSALQVDATVEGSGLQSGFYSFQTVTAHAKGPLLAPKVDAKLDTGGGDWVTASASVDAKAKKATDVTVQLSRKGSLVGGRVASVSASPGGVDIEGLSLLGQGIGELKGGLKVVGKEITGKLHGENVDLEKIAHLASYPGTLKGLANLDVDLSSSAQGSRKGHVAIELVDGDAAVLNGISGLFTATFDGDRVRADGLVRVVNRADPNDKHAERCDGAIAQVRITGGDGLLPGPLLDPKSWMELSGKIEVAADEWNLRCVRRLVPPFVPVPDVRGKLTTRVEVERAPGARLPTVKSLFARTKGLVINAGTWQSEHTDIEVKASVDGTSGETDATVSALDPSPDDKTPLATVSLGAKLDLAGLLDHPDQRLAIVRKAPLRGAITIPRRAITAFAGLPTLITERLPILTGAGGQTMAGDIEVGGKIEGTLDAPHIEETVKAFGLADVMIVRTEAPAGGDKPAEQPVLGPWGMPIDAEVVTRYDGKKATVDAHVDHEDEGHVKQRVLTASGELVMPVADLMAGRFEPKGRFQADFDQVPLGSVPFFQDRSVSGKLSGQVRIEGIGTKPSVNTKLLLPGLTVGQVAFPESEVSLEVSEPRPTDAGDRSEAKVQVALKGGTGGTFTTSVSKEIGWERGLVPKLDLDSAAHLDVHADRFRLAIAEPFIENVVSRMDGFLDGDVHLSFQPPKKGSGGAGGTRLGNVKLKLTGGVFHLPQLGQELHGITLAVNRDPSGKLLFQDIRAEGSKGLLTGSGSAELVGLVPKKVDLGLSIKQGDALPLSLAGAPIGEVYGETKVDMARQSNGDYKVTVAIAPMHVDLSPALIRSLGVAKEGGNPDITILHAPKKREESAPAAAGSTIAIDFTPVKIGMKGKILGRFPVEGTLAGDKSSPLRVVIGGDKARISGVVDLPRFSIGVFQKELVIEGGTITLNPEDVEKSFINISARWDSPDGPLYVDYAGEIGQFGPLIAQNKLQDKLKCRAANLSQERCLIALVMGTDQGTAAGGGQATQGQAAVTQAIASEFNTELVGGISTNLGTGDDGSFRPGLQYKKGDTTIDLSTYGAGASSSTTTTAGAAAPKGQHSLLTLDWRFWRNWSLRGKVDVGSDTQSYGADVLWQYRY